MGAIIFSWLWILLLPYLNASALIAKLMNIVFVKINRIIYAILLVVPPNNA